MASFLQLPAAALIQVPASSDVAFLLASEFFSLSLSRSKSTPYAHPWAFLSFLSLKLHGFPFLGIWICTLIRDLMADNRRGASSIMYLKLRCCAPYSVQLVVLAYLYLVVAVHSVAPSVQLRACTRILRREAAAQLTFYTGRGGKVLQRGALNAPVPAYQDSVCLSLSPSPTAKCQHTRTNSNGNSRSWWGRVGIANNTSYR